MDFKSLNEELKYFLEDERPLISPENLMWGNDYVVNDSFYTYKFTGLDGDLAWFKDKNDEKVSFPKESEFKRPWNYFNDSQPIQPLPQYKLEPNKAKSNNLRRDYIQAHGKEYQESLNEDTGMYGGFYKEELKLIDKLTDLIQTPAIVEHKSLITDRIELELDKEICGYGARFTIYNHITNENSDGSGVYHVMIDLHNFMPKQMPYEMIEILDELPLRMKDSYYIINEDTEDLESIPQKAADIINDILVKLNNIVKDDEYKPYQVMNKDTGDVWEFSDLKDAKTKETEEREKDFHADLRTAKVNKSGEFVKWV